MAQATSGFLGIKGISGPIYRLDYTTNTPYIGDDGAFVVLDSNGFYRVQIEKLDQVKKTATILITPYSSKRKFIRNPEKSTYGGFVLSYIVTNKDEIVDGSQNVTTPGTFDTYFALSVVRGNNTSEHDRARDFVLSLNGTSRLQETFPINFSSMSVDSITQTNIDNALA